MEKNDRSIVLKCKVCGKMWEYLDNTEMFHRDSIDYMLRESNLIASESEGVGKVKFGSWLLFNGLRRSQNIRSHNFCACKHTCTHTHTHAPN